MPLAEYVVYHDDMILVYHGRGREDAYSRASLRKQVLAVQPANLCWVGWENGETYACN